MLKEILRYFKEKKGQINNVPDLYKRKAGSLKKKYQSRINGFGISK
jgi:hypothetical protein